VSTPKVSIIMRSFNEGWALTETLAALKAQAFTSWELIVIDSGSTDGSIELIRAAQPQHFIQIRPQEYNPSRVMNRGMRLAVSDFGVFLNADATPQGADWLGPLVEALQSPRVAAAFGRQIPRPDCAAVFACDYDRCFGPNRESAHWDHFFSMVSSGLRKDAWLQRGFREDLQYAEDDEYTRWCKTQGYEVLYVPESVVMHSHNYSPREVYRRAFGDAQAQAATWPGDATDMGWVRTVLAGWLRDSIKDLRFCLSSGRVTEWPHALRIRWHQRRGRLDGFRKGWQCYRQQTNSTVPSS
jgi:rhamnosyltransferase